MTKPKRKRMNTLAPTKELTQEKPPTEAALVQKLRGDRSFRDFENYLNENIPAKMPGTTTFASAWNWVNDVHPVTGSCLMAWIAFYPETDPRHQLAKAIIDTRMGTNEVVEDKPHLVNVLDTARKIKAAK